MAPEFSLSLIELTQVSNARRHWCVCILCAVCIKMYKSKSDKISTTVFFP